MRVVLPRRLVGVLAGLAVLLSGVALLTACDESVDPTLGTPEVFTIWGALDPTSDRQALRVAAITNEIGASPAEIDAEVTATDLTSGASVAFRDSLVTFEDGATGYVFFADWTPLPGRTYRVDARRTADDATASAEIRVPEVVVPVVSLGLNTPSEVVYEVRAERVPRVRFGELALRVSGLQPMPADTVEVVVLPLDRVETFGVDWGRDVSFIETVREYLRAEGIPPRTVSLVDATYRLYVTNAEWEVPEGGFDIDEVSEPGTFSNVTGGFGFVGAGYWTGVSWVPALATQVRAGFIVQEDPAAQVFINEINIDGWVELYNPTLEPLSISGYGVEETSGKPPTVPFPVGTVVPARGFYVVDLGIEVDQGTQVFLLNPAGAAVGSLFVDESLGGEFEPVSYGSYPDGFTFVPSRGTPDIFRGGILPSREAPNQVDDKPWVINEVFTGGADDGWVEVVFNGLVPPTRLRVGTTGPGVWQGPMPSQSSGLFRLFRESASQLDLPLTGGQVFVMNQDPKSGVGRVVDARFYGPQAAGTSSGYLPDGLSGTWTSGLTPTRLAPNGGSPFASR
ncbi:MAG: lamin tail domain-containing protein [Bacteroidota bacterium]